MLPIHSYPICKFRFYDLLLRPSFTWGQWSLGYDKVDLRVVYSISGLLTFSGQRSMPSVRAYLLFVQISFLLQSGYRPH